jgi:peptidoglycan/LPS O-acetylase OafA/YrhL
MLPTPVVQQTSHANPFEPLGNSQTDDVRFNASKVPSERIYYLDNLRAIAMLLGVFLHAGLAYAKPAQSVWLATDGEASVVIDASIWFIHLFRMSLFFLLSGYLAKLVIERKGPKIYFWNRALRIALTMVLFYPLLLVAMTATIIFAISYLEAPTGLMGLFAAASQGGPAVREETPITTMHLWFLYYLIFFAIATVLCVQIPRLKFDWLFSRPALLVLFPLILLPSVLQAGVPLPAPESFVPTWWPCAFYGFFYWLGWQLRGRESMLDRLSPYVWILLVASGLLFVPYYLCMPTLDLSLIMRGASPPRGWSVMIAAVSTCYLSVLLTILSLLLGKRFLQHRSPMLGWIADASFWVYLVHLPLVIFFQTLLIPLEWSVLIKLAITILSTLLFCMATYVVFVRYTPLGLMLHGKRSFP